MGASTDVLRVGVGAGILGLPHAGIARYVLDMLTAVLTLDPRIRLYLYAGRAIEPSLPPGNWVLRVDAKRRWLGETYWLQQECPRWMAQDGIEVFWGQSYMLPLRLAHPCARVVTLHDTTGVLYPDTMLLRRRINSRLHLGAALRVATRVVTDSLSTARLARLLFGVPTERMVTIYPGFTNRIRRPSQSTAASIVRKQFGLDAPYILTVGTVEPRKNLPILLDVLEAETKLPVLVVAGREGWRSRGTMQRIRDLQRRSRLRYLGRVEDADLGALYAAAQFMVYPSLYEGFGLPVLEAMACGCPVVCSRASSIPEVGGQAARYFAPVDREDLRRQMKLVLSDRHLREQMVRSGLVQAGRFSVRKAGEELAALFHEVAGKPSLGT